MPRQTFIFDRERQELVPKDEYYARKAEVNAPFVMGDTAAYQSMATGEMIEGRAQHRDHLKRHRLIEVGNDIPKPTSPKTAPDRRMEQIARVVYDKLRY